MFYLIVLLYQDLAGRWWQGRDDVRKCRARDKDYSSAVHHVRPVTSLFRLVFDHSEGATPQIFIHSVDRRIIAGDENSLNVYTKKCRLTSRKKFH